MKKNSPDSLDKAIARLLAKDGRMPVREIAEELDVAIPTIRSRIKKMVESGIFKTAGLLNPQTIDNIVIALVGITLVKQDDLETKLREIAALDEVHWAAVVTGRYDLMAEVVSTGGIRELYNFLSTDLPRIGGFRETESFVLMKTDKKWILPPCESKYDFDEGEGGMIF